MKYLRVFTDFAEDISQLGDAETGRLFRAMLLYAATGEEPTFGGNERFLWGTAKKNIDSQRRSYTAKCESMAAAREFNPNNKSDREQTEISLETDSGQLESVEDKDKEKEKENKKEIITSTHEAMALEILNGYSEELLSTVDDWLRYKREKRQSYGATGLKTLLGKIRRFASGYGEQAVIEVIRDSMSNSYQGIVWDWLNKRQKGGANGQSCFPSQITRGAIRYD